VSADIVLHLKRYFDSKARGWLNLLAANDLRAAEQFNAKTIDKETASLTMAS